MNSTLEGEGRDAGQIWMDLLLGNDTGARIMYLNYYFTDGIFICNVKHSKMSDFSCPVGRQMNTFSLNWTLSNSN